MNQLMVLAEVGEGRFGPRHPPPHDACCPLHSPQLNADNVSKTLSASGLKLSDNRTCPRGPKLAANLKHSRVCAPRAVAQWDFDPSGPRTAVPHPSRSSRGLRPSPSAPNTLR